MSEKQKDILGVFEQILPKMSTEDKSYLLGYGEGMSAAMNRKEDGHDKDIEKEAER